MRDRGQQGNTFDVALYTKSERQLRQLKSMLPTDAVQDLAGEVIRRLSERHETQAMDLPSTDQIDHFCFALLSEDYDAGMNFINDVRSVGASVDAVYLRYLAGAARRLGEWWDADLVPFTDVMLGTSRMYAIMNTMRHQIQQKASAHSKSALFVSVPGETHTLGVRMAADMFRQDGWDIVLKTDEDHDKLVAFIKQSDVPIVGISAGGEHALHALSRLVVALRIETPDKVVLVGGRIVDEAADSVDLIGVDGLLTDAQSAKAIIGDHLTDMQY